MCSILLRLLFHKNNLPRETEETNCRHAREQTVHSYLVAFAWRRQFYIIDFFFVYQIKFGKTKQKVITLVAATLKILLSVAKTNIRLSGRKFYAGNIYYLYWCIIILHISPYQHIKRCATEATHRKTRAPSCRQTNLYADRYFHTINGSRIFAKLISFMMCEKGYSYPIKKNIPVSAIIKFVWHNYYITSFAVCKYVQWNFIQVSFVRYKKPPLCKGRWRGLP